MLTSHQISRGFLVLLLAALGGTVWGADSQCREIDEPEKQNASILLHTYADKTGDDPESFSVHAVGNYEFPLDASLEPMTTQDLVDLINGTKGADKIKRIILLWPYSNWGSAAFAKRLAKIVKKPVLGFSGPAWWFPDGSIFAAQAEKASIAGPNEANVSECVSRDGKFHEREECIPLLKTHISDSGVFGNEEFVLSCDEQVSLAKQAQLGNAGANLKLYFFNAFVNVDRDRASEYLSYSALGGSALANYIAAKSLDLTSAKMRPLYRQLLSRAAKGGDKKARLELENTGAQ